MVLFGFVGLPATQPAVKPFEKPAPFASMVGYHAHAFGFTQPDCIPQPKVARRALPWNAHPKIFTNPQRGCILPAGARSLSRIPRVSRANPLPTLEELK